MTQIVPVACDRGPISRDVPTAELLFPIGDEVCRNSIRPEFQTGPSGQMLSKNLMVERFSDQTFGAGHPHAARDRWQ